MRRAPKPIPITAVHAPNSGRIAWIAEPKPNALSGRVKVEEKDRALRELHARILQDGYDPEDFHIRWTLIEAGWGWTAAMKEAAWSSKVTTGAWG